MGGAGSYEASPTVTGRTNGRNVREHPLESAPDR
jgi:hypothetical protein